MNKLSNTNNPLLEKMVKAAENTKPHKSEFPEEIIKIATKTPDKSLKEVLSQFGPPDDLDATEPMAQESLPDMEKVKQGLVDALIAICGGTDQCHKCIDQYSGSGPEEIPGIDEAIPAPMAAPY